MRFIVMIAMMGLGLSAFAADTSVNSTDRKIYGEKEVSYKCSFRSHHKKGLRCRAWGEVCVNFGKQKDGGTAIERGCDRDRDDNRLHISCTNGFEDNDRATARIERDRHERRGEDLIIKSVGRDDDRIEIEDFERFDGDRRGKESFRAKLSFDRKGDRGGRDDLVRDNEPRGSFFGGCRLSLERDLVLDTDTDADIEALQL